MSEQTDQQKELLALAEQSQRVVQAFWERQAKDSADGGFSVVDNQGVAKAFNDFAQSLWSNPAKLVEGQMQLWQDNMNLLQSFQFRAFGGQADPVKQAARGDRRFKDAAWDEELVSDYLKQSYLLSSDWINCIRSF